jgi:hypothetical protein
MPTRELGNWELGNWELGNWELGNWELIASTGSPRPKVGSS